jgi:digeranylgeranylglycerophospholipid reductase
MGSGMPAEPRHYDLLVVGAGFAGLACARHAAQRGLKVGVLERQPWPGHTVRTTGLLVREADELLGAPAMLTRRIAGVRLYTPAMRHFDLDAPGYYFSATDTPALLRWYAGQAWRAGAELHYGCAFVDAVREGGRILINGGQFSAACLVGADGANSRVARCFGLGRNQRYLIGVEAGFRNLPVAEDRLHCFVSRQLAPGYIGWMFTGVGGITQVGLACAWPRKPDLKAFLRHLAPLADFGRAELVEKRGGLIPVGGRVAPLAAECVLLLGDAAGLVSPLTAGGIHLAIESGIRGAGLLLQRWPASAMRVPRPVELGYPRFVWKRLLRRLWEWPLPESWLERLLRWGLSLRLARLVYFHRLGLTRWSGWRDLLRRL